MVSGMRPDLSTGQRRSEKRFPPSFPERGRRSDQAPKGKGKKGRGKGPKNEVGSGPKNEGLGLMARPNRALLWRRTRLRIAPVFAQDAVKWRLKRMPRQTLPVRLGYGITLVY